jgi:hypothetical protein
MTYEQLQRVLTKAVTTIERTERAQERLTLAQQEAQRTLQEMQQETQRAQQKTELGLQELKSAQQETERSMEKAFKMIGGIGKSIGDVVELVVLPGLKKKMNKYGHNFTAISGNKFFYKKNGNVLTEVDLFLENGDEVMIVEAKTGYNKGEISWLLNRAALLRKHEAITGIAGKTMYLAAAGMSFDADTRKTADEKGIYLIKLNDYYDNDKIEITPPKGKVGKW